MWERPPCSRRTGAAISAYKEALAWLYGTQRFGIKLGLENIQRLLRALEVPGERHNASSTSPAQTAKVPSAR